MLYAAFDANVGLSAYFCSLGFAANFAGNVLQHNTAADLWELAIQSAEPAALNTRTRPSLFASGSLDRPVWRHHHSCSKPHSESEGLAPTRAIGLISATHQFPFCSVRLKVTLGCHSGKQYSVNYPPKERPFGQLNHFY